MEKVNRLMITIHNMAFFTIFLSSISFLKKSKTGQSVFGAQIPLVSFKNNVFPWRNMSG